MVSLASAPGTVDTDTTISDAAFQASTERMEEQRLDFIARGMDKPLPPVNLGVAGDGVFRFRSTVRKTFIWLRIPRETGDVDKDVRAKKVFENMWSRELGSKWKSTLAIDAKVYQKIGRPYIEFTELARSQESFYETKDPMIAQYIRERMKEQDHAHIYQEARPLLATLPDGTQIEVQPVTREGQMAVAAQGG